MKYSLWVVVCLAGCHDGSPAVVSGSVVIDGESDASGVQVALAGPTSASTVTGADGVFRFEGLVSNGRYAVLATAGGTVEETLSTGANAGDPELAPLVFHAAGSLSGRVTRAGADRGNGGIVVSAQGSSGAALSDDSGEFVITGLRPGSYQLDALAGGFVPGSASGLMVRRGEVTPVPQIDLMPAPSGPPAPADLHGLTRLAGLPASAGVTVTLGNTSLNTTTAADGSFVLADPPSGAFSISFDFGAYHETIPQVLALPGAGGFYVGDVLSPLDGSTLVLPHGQRLQSGVVDEVVLSPNRDYLAYRMGRKSDLTRSADGSLFTTALSGGAPILIGDNVPPGWSFSPDGTRLLYATRAAATGAETYDLHTRPLGGGAVVDVLAAAAVFRNSAISGSYRYSSDGTSILVAEPPQNRLRVVLAAGGAATEVPNAAVQYGYLASPSGDEVVVQTCHGGTTSTPATCDLVRAPTSGATPIVLAADVALGGLVASPGWDHVVASTYGVRLLIVNLGTNQSVTVPAVSLIGLTPDGQTVVYVAANGDLASLPADGGPATVLAVSGSFYPPRTALSPAGTLVYFQGGSEVKRVPVAGGAVESLTGNSFFQFSPKGRWVELRGDGSAPFTESLAIGPAEGGVVTPIAAATVSPFQSFRADNLAFNSDESKLAYLADDGHSGESGWVEVTATDVVAPLRLGAAAIGVNGFSPDGSSVLYFTADHTTTLLAVPSDGSAAPVALLENAPQGQQVFPVRAFFAGDNQVAALCRQKPAPFDFQNGLYLLSVK
jgi:hypothetical protein